jgi:protein-tyrosine phosphatase
MLPWLRDGLLTQVTAASVVGNMGRTAQRIAEQMLSNRWVHLIATDAHDTKRRPPHMREAREHISKRHGALYADLLCRENPMAVFRGQPLGEQEDGVDLYEPRPLKTRWYQRFFSR